MYHGCYVPCLLYLLYKGYLFIFGLTYNIKQFINMYSLWYICTNTFRFTLIIMVCVTNPKEIYFCRNMQMCVMLLQYLLKYQKIKRALGQTDCRFMNEYHFARGNYVKPFIMLSCCKCCLCVYRCRLLAFLQVIKWAIHGHWWIT